MTCHVADQNCSAPANLVGAHTGATCFACGEPTCLRCSSRIRFLGYGRRRICFNCIEEYAQDTPNAEAAKRHIEHRLLHGLERNPPPAPDLWLGHFLGFRVA